MVKVTAEEAGDRADTGKLWPAEGNMTSWAF